MTDFTIGLPPETWWERTKAKCKLHPVIWAAVIAGVFGLAGIILGARMEAPKLRETVKTLEARIAERNNDIRAKEMEIQRLETLLTPFRTIALERYPGTEAQAMEQLAHGIQAIRTDLDQKADTIRTIQHHLETVDPANRIIRDAKVSIRLELTNAIATGQTYSGSVNAGIGFLKAGTPLLKISAAGGECYFTGMQSKTNSYIVFSPHVVDRQQTVTMLNQADTLTVWFEDNGIRDIAVFSGTVSCIFNDIFRCEYRIPPQVASPCLTIPLTNRPVIQTY